MRRIAKLCKFDVEGQWFREKNCRTFEDPSLVNSKRFTIGEHLFSHDPRGGE